MNGYSQNLQGLSSEINSLKMLIVQIFKSKLQSIFLQKFTKKIQV